MACGVDGDMVHTLWSYKGKITNEVFESIKKELAKFVDEDRPDYEIFIDKTESISNKAEKVRKNRENLKF